MPPVRNQLLPITLVSGFFGAGKTTLLNHLLSDQRGRRAAVIVSDPVAPRIPLDPPAISGPPSSVTPEAVETSCCFCCRRSSDLLERIAALARGGQFDYLIIEAAGICEPMAIAETLEAAQHDNETLFGLARLDTMVTVVDAGQFFADWSSEDDLRDRMDHLNPLDDRSVSRLLAEQVEFAHVLLINKIDLIAPRELDRLEGLLRRLNPLATIVRTSYGQVEVDAVVGTNRFQFDSAQQAPGWLRELRGQHVPACETAGIGSFVYRARLPFHPARFWDVFGGQSGVWQHVLRSKGWFWLASRMDLVGSWSQAGGSALCEGAGFWYAAMPKQDWPTDAEGIQDVNEMLEQWQAPYGDRRQELVFIGAALNAEKLRAVLDACLLDPAEMSQGPASWAHFPDPLPVWHSLNDSLQDEHA